MVSSGRREWEHHADVKSDLWKSRLPGDNGKVAGWPSVLGFVVADASLKPLFANHEAIAIMTCPRPPSQRLAEVFHKKVRASLLRAQSSPTNRSRAHAVAHFKSGRRTYFCRAILLDNTGKGC